jgi:glycerol kinase
MSDALLLAIDNGTSSTKCLVVDDRGQVVGRGQAPVSLATPEPGWVEQDANEIWRACVAPCRCARIPRPPNVVSVIARILRRLGSSSGEALTPVLSAGPADGEWLRLPARPARRRHQAKERAAAELHVLGRQGALVPRTPPIGASAPGRRRPARDDRLFILSRFGGEAVIEAGNASRTQPRRPAGAGTRSWVDFVCLQPCRARRAGQALAARGPPA